MGITAIRKTIRNRNGYIAERRALIFTMSQLEVNHNICGLERSKVFESTNGRRIISVTFYFQSNHSISQFERSPTTHG